MFCMTQMTLNMYKVNLYVKYQLQWRYWAYWLRAVMHENTLNTASAKSPVIEFRGSQLLLKEEDRFPLPINELFKHSALSEVWCIRRDDVMLRRGKGRESRRKKTAIPKIFVLATKGVVFKDKKRRAKHVYMKTRVYASILFVYLFI